MQPGARALPVAVDGAFTAAAQGSDLGKFHAAVEMALHQFGQARVQLLQRLHARLQVQRVGVGRTAGQAGVQGDPLQPATALLRLPEQERLHDLRTVAAAAYGAPSPQEVIAAPGTQILLPLVARLVKPCRVAVLSPTYAEHARAAAIAGHGVQEVRDFDELANADLAVVVNPNNPDGRVVSREKLLELAARFHAKGGLLVVDEAFMDVGPGAESLAGDVERGGMVVLPSTFDTREQCASAITEYQKQPTPNGWTVQCIPSASPYADDMGDDENGTQPQQTPQE